MLVPVTITSPLVGRSIPASRFSKIGAFLHRGEHMAHAGKRRHTMIRDLLTQAMKTGEVPGDIAAHELTIYCLHALAAARNLPSKAAVRRLVDVTIVGLRPPR